MFDLLTPDAWDDLRNWLATVGGLIVLTITASTYRRNVRIKREEQARLVYSKITHVTHHESGAHVDLLPNEAGIGNACPHMDLVLNPGPEGAYGLALAPLIQATAVIHNGSKELIGPVRIQVVDRGLKRTWDEFSITIGVVDPESEKIVDFKWINPHHPGQPSLGTTIIFRDASGEWWRRHLDEPIEHVHNDPENSGPTPRERIDIRASQVTRGYEPLAEHKLTLRVRWQRFWRKRKGKPPIP